MTWSGFLIDHIYANKFCFHAITYIIGHTFYTGLTSIAYYVLKISMPNCACVTRVNVVLFKPIWIDSSQIKLSCSHEWSITLEQNEIWTWFKQQVISLSKSFNLMQHVIKPGMETETKWNNMERMKYVHTTNLSSFLSVLYRELIECDGFSSWL